MCAIQCVCECVPHWTKFICLLIDQDKSQCKHWEHWQIMCIKTLPKPDEQMNRMNWPGREREKERRRRDNQYCVANSINYQSWQYIPRWDRAATMLASDRHVHSHIPLYLLFSTFMYMLYYFHTDTITAFWWPNETQLETLNNITHTHTCIDDDIGTYIDTQWEPTQEKTFTRQWTLIIDLVKANNYWPNGCLVSCFIVRYWFRIRFTIRLLMSNFI